LQRFRSGLENENAKKKRFAAKALQNLRAPLCLAQKMGKRLGSCSTLQRKMPAK